MLVLSRKIGESIQIGDEIRLTVLSVSGQNVKLGIVAPAGIPVHREEIYDKIVAENQLAASRASLANAETLRQLRVISHG